MHCSHDAMLRTKQTHTYTYYEFIQQHYTQNTPAQQIHHCQIQYCQYINPKYTSPFFLSFTYCIKDSNLQGILRNYDPIAKIYTFCPLTKIFNVDKSRPLIVPHEFLQPVEIPILDFIHNTRYNQKIYNLIQNTPYELSPSTEEHNTIKALEMLWRFLQTKYIIRLLAKLKTSSEIKHDIFPHGFFTDEYVV